MSSISTHPAFDPDSLRERYRVERDKRLRADGNDQYVEVRGDYAHFVDDPYITEPIERAPRNDEVDVVLIGGTSACGRCKRYLHYRKRWGLWRHLVLEPLSRRPM